MLLWTPAVAAAQSLAIPIPKALIFPNYDNVLVGKNQALEGSTYIARADDASANFYNPAGLVVSEKTSLNASSTGYVWTPASCCAASPRWFRRRALTSSATTACSGRPPTRIGPMAELVCSNSIAAMLAAGRGRPNGTKF